MEKSVATSKATARVIELFQSTGMGVSPFEQTIGVAEGTIKNLLNHRNNASLDTVCAVADYFDVSADYVIGYTDFPKCPTSWYIFRRTLTRLNKALSTAAEELNKPLTFFVDWENGKEPTDKELWEICNRFELKVNPFEKIKKQSHVKELPAVQEIALDISDEVLTDHNFVDTIKLCNGITAEQRAFVLGAVLGVLQTLKVDTKKILGY